jgi:hypothetical protein
MLVVRFEELCDDLEGTLRRVLAFLGVAIADYDFSAACRLPVRGSSVYGLENGEVHWGPVEVDDEFDPTSRWRHWDPHRLRRFDRLAGRELEALGYERSPVAGRWAPGDLVYGVRSGLRTGLGRLSRRLEHFDHRS